ncbi:hypothetical protein HMPREF9554_01868 [Treponema phagedenis F0421]|nr:hypothetical protein HMPREF9554_01868 [Treponema phagedenis F0421]
MVLHALQLPFAVEKFSYVPLTKIKQSNYTKTPRVSLPLMHG